MNCSFFCTFRSIQEDQAATSPFPTPQPSSFLLSLASVLMTKGAPRRRTFHAKLLRCPAWAGVREGGVYHHWRQSISNRSLCFFLRWKTLEIRLILRKDRDATGQGFLTSLYFWFAYSPTKILIVEKQSEAFYMHLSKVNLLSLIPRRREEVHYLLNS